MFSGLFSAMFADIALKICKWLYIYDLQIKFEDVVIPIFGRVMSLELSHLKGFYSFPTFFSLCLQIFILNYLVHCFAILSCRSISSLVLIYISLGIRNISWFISFPHFFSLLTDIHLIFVVHCFAILSCRSSSSLDLIHKFIPKS
jgi:hypothetical protein